MLQSTLFSPPSFIPTTLRSLRPHRSFPTIRAATTTTEDSPSQSTTTTTTHKLNKSQGASQAVLYGVGLSDDDLSKPQIGVSSVWYEGNTCNMPLLRLSKKA